MERFVAERQVGFDGDGGEDARRTRGVVPDHFATLRGTRGRLLWIQIGWQIIAPLAAGYAVYYCGFRITIVGDLIAGFSVLAGFLFGLVIFVFQLRLGMTTDPRVQGRLGLPRLIDELFSNVLYAVGVSFLLTVLTIVCAATEPLDKDGRALGLDPIASGAVTLVAVHLLAVIGMCLKRTRRAYSELKS